MAATAVRRPQQAPTLAAVQVAAEPTLAGLPAPGAIEMEFANGSRMRVTGARSGDARCYGYNAG
jgi:hypothetical protein